MNHFEKTAGFCLFMLIATTYAASIGANQVQPQIFNLQTSNATSFPKIESNRDRPETEYPISPSYLSVADTQNSFAIGKVIAEVMRRIMDMVSKMELSEQSLKNLVEVAVPLVSLYWGPYSQVILPFLSGIVSVLFKSMVQ